MMIRITLTSRDFDQHHISTDAGEALVWLWKHAVVEPMDARARGYKPNFDAIRVTRVNNQLVEGC